MAPARTTRAAMGATAMLAVAVAVAVAVAAPAGAAPQPWTGRYQMVTYASQKAGTSPAARQREADFAAVFTLSTACSVTQCVATVIDGPPPANPSVPQPTRYSWNGSGWALSYDWLWDCLLGDGSRQWARATSWSSYVPRPDGSLRGTWHTDISEGACRGSVVMPVAAFPA